MDVEVPTKGLPMARVTDHKKSVMLLPSPTIIADDMENELPQLILNSEGRRPSASRSFTDPSSPTSPSYQLGKMSSLTIQPRNRSPYSRPHLRSRSTASSLSAPPISRSQSSPTADTFRSSSPVLRPSSPLYSSTRRVSPLRRSLDEPSFSFSGLDIDQTISENSELDITPRQTEQEAPTTPLTPSSPYSSHGTFPQRGIRRRPSSPLHLPPMNATPTSRLHASVSSPSLRTPSSPAKYNEAFPVSTPYASSLASAHSTISNASSIPSTPTSFRSRSPSISSLETIPDSPDAEQEAVEQTEQEMKEREQDKGLKMAMENQGVRTRGRSLGRDRGGERKRWSVCGAERRGDLDVIWED